MRTVLLLAALLVLPLASAALPAPVPVVAAGNAYASPVLVVPAGSTVQWVGAALPHTVTSAASLDDALAGKADGAYRGALPMTGSFSQMFNAAGDHFYFCELHAHLGMVGQITVV